MFQKISILFLIYFSAFFVSASAAEDLKKYVGVWSLIKHKDKSKNDACPDKIVIKSAGKNKLRLVHIKNNVTRKYIFHKDKTIQGKNKMEYKKEKFPTLDESHTVKTIYNTAIVNGNLSVNMLWSSSKIDGTVSGVKVFSINKAGILNSEKVVSGYVNEKGKNVRSELIQKVFFRHPNNYSMNSSAFSCQLKLVKQAKKIEEKAS